MRRQLADHIEKAEADFAAAHVRSLGAAILVLIGTAASVLVGLAIHREADQHATIAATVLASVVMLATVATYVAFRLKTISTYNSLRSAIAAERGFKFSPTIGLPASAASDAGVRMQYDEFSSSNLLQWGDGSGAAVNYIQIRRETYYETVTETSPTGATTTRQVQRTRTVRVPVLQAFILQFTETNRYAAPFQLISRHYASSTGLDKQTAAPSLLKDFCWLAGNAYDLHEAMHPVALAAVVEVASQVPLISLKVDGQALTLVVAANAMNFGRDRPGLVFRPSTKALRTCIGESVATVRAIDELAREILTQEKTEWNS